MIDEQLVKYRSRLSTKSHHFSSEIIYPRTCLYYKKHHTTETGAKEVEALVRASDQNITDRQGLVMQILLVAGLKIVLFTSEHTVTNVVSVRGANNDTCSQAEC